MKKGELASPELGLTEKTWHEVAGFFKPLEDDRPLEEDLRRTLALIEEQRFCL